MIQCGLTDVLITLKSSGLRGELAGSFCYSGEFLSEHRQAARVVALKPYNLRQTAAVPVGSAVEHCKGILFGARSPLERLVRNVKSKNFLFRFSFANHPIVHGVFPLIVCQLAPTKLDRTHTQRCDRRHTKITYSKPGRATGQSQAAGAIALSSFTIKSCA